MKKYNNLLHFFPVRMQKIFQEVGDWLVCDVAAHHDMPPESRVDNMYVDLDLDNIYYL